MLKTIKHLNTCLTYHPFNLEGDEGAERENDPDARTNNQSNPEDSGF